MKNNAELQYQIEQFLYANASKCDQKKWDEYLDDFDEKLEFHVPQWKSEHEYTTNPKREMSLIYYSNRGGLEDRIFRVETEKSSSAYPLPRTLHQISNVRILGIEGDEIIVEAGWDTSYIRMEIVNRFFGVVHYRIKRNAEQFKITYKQVILMNDKINAVLDFYHI
nr:aromatic-ring-hydroxylating dioxygenase subunit beta [Acinetobacter sp. Marseille-Q1620]